MSGKPRKKPGLVPQPHGGALLRGPNDGNGGGRPPDEFKRKLAEIASHDETLRYLEECAHGKHGHQAAASARDYSSDRGYGKVPSVTKIEGGDEPLKIIVEHATKPSDG